MSVNDYNKNTLLKRKISVPCGDEHTSAVSVLRQVFRMESYVNPSEQMIVSELTESVESATHVCVIYSMNVVCDRMHRFPRNIQRNRLDLLMFEIHNVCGRTITVFVHEKLLNVAVFAVSAVVTVAITVLVLLPRTSPGLFLASIPPLFSADVAFSISFFHS